MENAARTCTVPSLATMGREPYQSTLVFMQSQKLNFKLCCHFNVISSLVCYSHYDSGLTQIIQVQYNF